MKLTLIYDDQPVSLTGERDGDGWRVRLPNGSDRLIAVRRLPDGMLEVREGDRVFRAAVARIGGETHVSLEGSLYVFEPAAAERAPSGSKTSGDLTAPMPGVVVDVLVAVGDRVAAYQPVAVVEAMKVMATVEAPMAGVVKEILVVKGQRVAQGERLAEIAPEERDDA
jgi:biotin carboxyl carrier protein